MNPAITIIVPVYNAEKFLHRCLDSIIYQTFTNWECILIDDGSPDNSGAICDDYVARDSRFRVIHQENKGVSAARNAGLDSAKGNWIGFVDSDDWCEPNMLENMYNTVQMTGEGHDMILCKIQDTLGLQGFASDSSYSFFNNKYGLCFQSAWGKLYRHSVITSHKLRFPIGSRLGEDTFFTFSFLVHAPNFFFLNKPLYHYFNSNQSSAVNNKSYDTICNARDTFKKLEKYVTENGQIERFKNTLFSLKLWIKNLFIEELKAPNPNEWRKTFPELNKSLLLYKNIGLKRRILYLLIITHIYDILLPILKLKKRGN
ncbi:MAG: glycosyltransferase [Treponema sp.]|nr:glycosyltransferase [Treponema sp.]